MTFWDWAFAEPFPWGMALWLSALGFFMCALPYAVEDQFRPRLRPWLLALPLPWGVALAHYSIEGGNGMWVAVSLGIIGFFAGGIVKLVLGHRERIRKMELDTEIVRQEQRS